MESKKIAQRNHQTWLDTIKGSSRRTYDRAWGYFVKFLDDKDEAWIIASKVSHEDWGAHLVDFHRWLKIQPKQRGQGTLSDNSAKQIAGAIRGYMKHMGLPISLTMAQKAELDTIETLTYKDYRMDLKIKEQLLQKANALEEYIVSAGISFGLRIGDFAEISRGMLEPLLEKEIPIQLPKIKTKKRGEDAYPFIDSDAKKAILRLLKQMDKEGKTGNADLMIDLGRKFPENAINTILKNLAKKSGVNLGTYRLRFHCLRKFLTDNLSAVCSADKWKWFVGKKTSGASPYVSHEGREAYKQVLRLTQVGANQTGTSSDNILQKQLKLRDEEISILKNEMVDLQDKLDKINENRQNDMTEISQKILKVLLKKLPEKYMTAKEIAAEMKEF